MGAAGGSFGQSFANTLIQGMQLQTRLAQEQQDLEIRSKLAKAQLDYHNAQTAALNQKALAASKLAAKMLPQNIGGGLEGPNTTMPGGQISPQDLASYAAESGDVGPLFKLFEPQPFDPTKGYSTVVPATGAVNQIAAPQPPPMHPLAEQALRNAGLGAPPAPGAPPAEQSQGEGAPAPAQPSSPLNPGGIRYEPPKISVDPKGGVTISSQATKMNIHVEKIEYPKGSDQFQSVAVAIDPTNPNNRQMIPLGKPLPSEQMQKFESIASSWGIPPGEVRKWAVGAIADVTTTYTGPAQAIAMEDLKAKLQGAVGKGGGGTATSAKTPLERAKQLEVQTAGEKTAAEVQAKNANEPPQAGAQQKLGSLQSVERQMNLVQQNFKPEFVGKGFGQFSDKLKAEYAKQESLAEKGKYASGALAGNLRQFFGNISPEEVTFRNALLDSSDLLLRARSGAQINEQEYNRLKSILPNLTDEPNVFLPAMKRFQDEVNSQINDTLKMGSTSSSQMLKERQQPKKGGAPAGFTRE